MTRPTIKLVKKNSRVNLTTIAYESIKNMILRNEIAPGEFLSENSLALSLEMSRTPVREALKVLANENLVEIHNGIGIHVKTITTKEVYDIFEVRASLECTALETFLQNISEEEVDIMLASWLEFKKRHTLGEKIPIELIIENDKVLHQTIVDKCNNAFLQDIMAGIREKTQRFQDLSVRRYPDVVETIQQHLDILEAMKMRDLESLSKILRMHIHNAGVNLTNNPNWRY